MTYGSTAWHFPKGVGKYSKAAESKLTGIQNRCLRAVTAAFRAAPVKAREAITYVTHLSFSPLSIASQGTGLTRGSDQYHLQRNVGKPRGPDSQPHRHAGSPGIQKATWTKTARCGPRAAPFECYVEQYGACPSFLCPTTPPPPHALFHLLRIPFARKQFALFACLALANSNSKKKLFRLHLSRPHLRLLFAGL